MGKQGDQWKPCSSSTHPSWLHEMKPKGLLNITWQEKVIRFTLWEWPGNAMPVGTKKHWRLHKFEQMKRGSSRTEGKRQKGEKNSKSDKCPYRSCQESCSHRCWDWQPERQHVDSWAWVSLWDWEAEVGRWQWERQYRDHRKDSLEEPYEEQSLESA